MPKRVASVREHFYSKLEVAESECWIWKGGKYPDGYGVFCFHRTRMAAHRASIMIHRPKDFWRGAQVNHKCSVRSCVNPDHLYVGTQSDNMIDCVEAGAHNKASRSRCPKGHSYEGANLRVDQHKGGGPHRVCRACAKARR